jgi:hypothetical protein
MIILLSYINTVTVLLFTLELTARYIAIGIDNQFKGVIGRIKYTFKFYTLVDIISILPFFLLSYNISFFQTVRLLRFIRILKLIRMQKIIKKFININAFASSNLVTQSIILIGTSAVLIYIFSYAYGSFSESAMIFLDPPQIAEFHTDFHIAIGIIELIAGLFIGGALISIITSSLEEMIKSINNGYFTFKESGHIVIINNNLKLNFILEEINKYYLDEQKEQSIVILLRPSTIESFKNNLKKYTNLEIIVIAGENLNWNSYERVNINKASKTILLLSSGEIKNENKKITKFIVDHENFTNNNLSFVIETEQITFSYEIYDYIFQDLPNIYTLINNNDLISKILNRSVVNYNYFKIYSELLSFDGKEFYVIDILEITESLVNFQEISLRLKNSVVVGIVRNKKVLLNPSPTTKLYEYDKLILIMEDRFSYKILPENPMNKVHSLTLPKPKLKEKCNMAIVGNYTDIDKKDITQFLEDESISNFKLITANDDDYMDRTLWDKCIDSNFDVIILNLEDEYEFTLLLYLNSIYRDNPNFLSKIVNIFHNPTIANLISNNKNTHSVILSQKLIGEFIAQSLFNHYVYDIFDEITQTKGSELYILSREKYKDLYKLNYNDLKSTLLINRMIYIGAIVNNELCFYSENINKAEMLIVLAEGES